MRRIGESNRQLIATRWGAIDTPLSTNTNSPRLFAESRSFSGGECPCQHADVLTELWNALVHLTTEWGVELDRLAKPGRRLVWTFERSDNAAIAECASQALVAIFSNHVSQRMPELLPTSIRPETIS